MLKHVAILLEYDAKQSYPHHSLYRLNRQTGGAYGCEREEWSDEADAAKVMIAFEYGCLSAANRGKDELGEQMW